MTTGRLTRIVGALAEARGMRDVALNELVRVGDTGLLAEVLAIEGDLATLQVFEETRGLAVGEAVRGAGAPIMAELGPGLLGSVIDGLGRPLAAIARTCGPVILPGVSVPPPGDGDTFHFEPCVEAGQRVGEGDVLGTVAERGLQHRILVPPGRSGVVRSVRPGPCTPREPVVMLDDDGQPLALRQRWPVRRPRPVAARLGAERPFLTGQRVFDFLFPVPEGGTVAVPGGFGTGKTIIEQSLARFAAADIVVYIGCGERGNEMAELLEQFATLVDPRTGKPVLDRTVLIVNTSNMPVAAREASLYLGMTVAEYFRDQGWRVAVLADSLSRWAEALREIGSRMAEMPGEEGYPTRLSSRTAQVHERAGRVRCVGRPDRTGSVTLVSAVSPPGGDFSEPVTQACLRVAGALWALDPALAHQRQFPAVDWQQSYSLAETAMSRWFDAEVDPQWSTTRAALLSLLQRDAELREVAGVVGADALQDADRLLLAAAAIVRECVLGQSAFDPNDACSAPDKTAVLARMALALHDAGRQALARGATLDDLPLGDARRAIGALRDSPEADREARAALARQLVARVAAARAGAAGPEDGP